MSIDAHTEIKFADMPTDYTSLCQLFLLRPIHSDSDYAAVSAMADVMAVHEPAFTTDQEDYFDMLCRLLETWDREHVSWPLGKDGSTLQELLDLHQFDGADLSRILRVPPEVGPMVLRGERELTVGQARSLGTHFGLPAAVFIG